MKTTNIKEILPKFLYIFLIPLFFVLFWVLAANIVSALEYPNSDFFSFWLSGRLLSLGQSPYEAQIWISSHHHFNATWISDSTFLYPLPLALLFAPLGLLPLYYAFVLWNVLTQIMIITSAILLLRMFPRQSRKHFILPLFAGIILFRPTIITLINGQLSGLLLLVVVAIIYSWEKGKWEQGASLMAILALKPNLGLPIIGLLYIYLILQKQRSALIAGLVSIIFLITAGLIKNPNWIMEFINIGNTKLSQTFGYSPTIWGVSASFCDHRTNCTIAYGVLISFLFLGGFSYLYFRKVNALSPSLLVSLVITITLLLTPYTWTYDQLLLIAPITIITLKLSGDGYRFLFLSFLFIAIDIFALILLGISARVQLEIWNVFIPFFVLCLLVWYLLKDKASLPVTAG